MTPIGELTVNRQNWNEHNQRYGRKKHRSTEHRNQPAQEL